MAFIRDPVIHGTCWPGTSRRDSPLPRRRPWRPASSSAVGFPTRQCPPHGPPGAAGSGVRTSAHGEGASQDVRVVPGLVVYSLSYLALRPFPDRHRASSPHPVDVVRSRRSPVAGHSQFAILVAQHALPARRAVHVVRADIPVPEPVVGSLMARANRSSLAGQSPSACGRWLSIMVDRLMRNEPLRHPSPRSHSAGAAMGDPSLRAQFELHYSPGFDNWETLLEEPQLPAGVSRSLNRFCAISSRA